MNADQASSSDRRTDKRNPIELRVEYKRLNTFFSDYTRNISQGGTFIRTEKALPVGTEFVFCLVVPKRPEPLRLLGQVMWVIPQNQATDDNPAGMGIEFRYRDDSERQAIHDWVSSAMVDELGAEIVAGLFEKKQG